MQFTPNGANASTFDASSPAIAPRPLPAALQPLFDLVVSLTRKTGYCFARTQWIADRIGVTRQHAWRLLNKLAAFGRLRIEAVPGSHERRLHPVFLRPSRRRGGDEQVTKSARTIRQEPARQETADTGADAPAPGVAALVDAGVLPPVARELAGAAGADRVARVLAWARGRGERTKRLPALVVAALKGGWEVGDAPAGSGGGASPPETAAADADRHEREREKQRRCGHVDRALWPALERRARAKLAEKRIYPGAGMVAEFMRLAYEADVRDGRA